MACCENLFEELSPRITRMKISTPLNRSWLLCAVFFCIVTQVFWMWFSLRFWLYDASYRALAPEHYQAEVITPDDYRRLAEPGGQDVTLSNGHRMIDRQPVWYRVVLPNYKPTDDGQHYVLVTTTGTAHILPYVEGYFILIGFPAICGLIISVWNLGRVAKELRPGNQHQT